MEFSNMSVDQIKKYLASKQYKISDSELRKLKVDNRSSVKQLYNKTFKKLQAEQNEKIRLRSLFDIERDILKGNHYFIAGIDEVGRGPIAGPVVAAAVVFKEEVFIPGLNDSKKLSESSRIEIEKIIKAKAASWGIGVVEPDIIDTINISKASFEAMKIAVENLSLKPDYLLVDGFTIPDVMIDQTGVIKGDQNSASIAAASIIAKCARDRIMVGYHETYPEYDFKSHKGYGTNKHYQAIQKHGLTPIHRHSFLKNFLKDIDV